MMKIIQPWKNLSRDLKKHFCWFNADLTSNGRSINYAHLIVNKIWKETPEKSFKPRIELEFHTLFHFFLSLRKSTIKKYSKLGLKFCYRFNYAWTEVSQVHWKFLCIKWRTELLIGISYNRQFSSENTKLSKISKNAFLHIHFGIRLNRCCCSSWAWIKLRQAYRSPWTPHRSQPWTWTWRCIILLVQKNYF